MLTRVILEGALGKKFGREWNLNCNSPYKALELIDANRPGIFGFIRSNAERYQFYEVIVDGDKRNNDSYHMKCRAKEIRFIPVIAGSGGAVGKVFAGVAVAVASYYMGPAAMGANSILGSGTSSLLMSMGTSLALAGVTQMLTKNGSVSSSDGSESTDKTSHYFDGAVNTEKQGVAIPLIYGTVLTGSHVISAKLTVAEG